MPVVTTHWACTDCSQSLESLGPEMRVEAQRPLLCGVVGGSFRIVRADSYRLERDIVFALPLSTNGTGLRALQQAFISVQAQNCECSGDGDAHEY
jgi:hypothetical protein